VATLERRIHFYELRHWVAPSDGGNVLKLIDDPTAPYTYIKGLPASYDSDPNRYMKLSDGNELIMEIVDATETKVRGRFGSKRRTGLPQVEEAGAYTSLALAAQAGLAEIRHFIFYVPEGRLGIEVNGTAPTISRFGTYVGQMAPGVDLVTTEMLLAGDAAALLKRVTRIAGASVTLPPENAEVLDQIDPHLGAGIRELNKVDESARRVKVAFELVSQKKSETLDLGLKEKLASFLSKKENREAVDDVTVRGYDEFFGFTRAIDLLDDKFVGIRKVVTLGADDRVVDSESVFKAIEETAATLP
jgi:hypothetical protein